MTNKIEEINHDRIKDDAINALMRLTDKERLEIFERFCTHCGCVQLKDSRCQCWNDD